MARCSDRPLLKKIILLVSLGIGLGTLSIFKYSVFFAHSLESVFLWAGISVDLVGYIPKFCLILPVGISFYTFQSMSYTIDVYRGELRPTRSIVHYFSYLMLFPQLVAGPIVRASDFLYQLLEQPKSGSALRYSAIKLIIIGFFKKCVIADNLAYYVNAGFDSSLLFQSAWVWWLIMICFAIQIYCDFSGYSDIARGLIKMMGYNFILNFNHPYVASSFKDFWSRWHISLSTWFRDYVYLPLGGSRHATWPLFFSLLNLWVLFLLSGLWHGAAWSFVIWGALHALYLSVEKVTNYPKRMQELKYGWILAVVLVQIQVLLAWVFFRAASLPEAMHVIKCMLFNWRFSADDAFLITKYMFIYLGVFAALEFIQIKRLDEWLWRFCRPLRHWLEPVVYALIGVVTIIFRGDGNVFIYFQF